MSSSRYHNSTSVRRAPSPTNPKLYLTLLEKVILLRCRRRTPRQSFALSTKENEKNDKKRILSSSGDLADCCWDLVESIERVPHIIIIIQTITIIINRRHRQVLNRFPQIIHFII